MNTRTIILILHCVLVGALPMMARDKTDVLVMKNGDRMTCEVKGLDGGVLYVSFDYIDGTTSIDWSKVARLESGQLFIVTTQDGSVYMGTLRTPEAAAGMPVKIEVVQSVGETMINRSQVVRMTGTSDKFWQRFNGQLSFGTIYSKGNQSTQYTLGSQVAYIRKRWRAYSDFESTLSSSTGTNVSTRNSLALGVLRLMPWNNWFYSGLGGFLQSSEQGIALQTTVGGGIGRYLKNTNRWNIALLGGAAWQSTDYKQTTAAPLGKQNIAAALIHTEASFFKFSRTNLEAKASLLPAVSDPGRLFFNTNTTYYIKLFSNLKWNISFYGNWDNRPPPGLAGSDYGTSSGVSWTFGLK